ncbi:alcohol dehydrogenase GroES-like domain-containing protein [Colletotrichum graminicola]|uniref:Alcohol dehydrogenase GroES-like domain-containing protein n=1 Tax=Colletotrichum graminicola (strain M1.001 / M2 / FGSC 10212) TaxID=645133 RepID=E3QU39_COLGM|nr:alcohol dehydrogenase GroES-like domain-containing protein [Colletotrichum graminicola M1.001]EFQ34377.1 alcohol dehydrogenase GroES-like domain-containing protein [Colletotrichum graminicola M1.001]WDK22541.1 alcohol dehydrogenase GroES-like domain-containing protein [Colletotrichum graminicola]
MSETPPSSAHALYVDKDCNLKAIRNVPVPELVDGEVVVKVLYSGVNSADVKHGPILGVRPTILGYDFCGRVAQSAPTSGFRVGDLVAVFTPTGVGKPSRYGAHQEYLSCPENFMYKVPENLPPTHAASLTTVAPTAADGLYNIGLPNSQYVRQAEESFEDVAYLSSVLSPCGFPKALICLQGPG